MAGIGSEAGSALHPRHEESDLAPGSGGAKKIPFHFYDYSLFFYDTKEAVFTDYIHINPEANKKIASAIGDVVSSMMEKVVEKQK